MINLDEMIVENRITEQLDKLMSDICNAVKNGDDLCWTIKESFYLSGEKVISLRFPYANLIIERFNNKMIFISLRDKVGERVIEKTYDTNSFLHSKYNDLYERVVGIHFDQIKERKLAVFDHVNEELNRRRFQKGETITINAEEDRKQAAMELERAIKDREDPSFKRKLLSRFGRNMG